MTGKELYELWIKARNALGGNARTWVSLKVFEQRAWQQLADMLDENVLVTDKHYDKARGLLDRAHALLAAENSNSALYDEITDFLGVIR